MGKYVALALKRTTEDRKVWQTLLRPGSHTPASQQITLVAVSSSDSSTPVRQKL